MMGVGIWSLQSWQWDFDKLDMVGVGVGTGAKTKSSLEDKASLYSMMAACCALTVESSFLS